MVAFACFVLNLVMLGQIFNITPSDRALIPWAALAFLLAYACDLRLLLAAGICCVIAFVAARVGAWSGIYWLHSGERPENFFPVAALLFAFPLLFDHSRQTGFATIYRVFGLLCLLVPMLVLGHWGWGSYLADLRGLYDARHRGRLRGGGLRRQCAGDLDRRAAAVAGHVNTGITFFVIFLYTKFFDWWWATMPKWLFFLVLGLAAILILLVLKRLRRAGAMGGGGAMKPLAHPGCRRGADPAGQRGGAGRRLPEPQRRSRMRAWC
jgi:hypothetical protein